MNEVLLVGGMAAVTFLIRYPALALVGKLDLPKPIFEALGYVPGAVLAAFIVPDLLMPDGKSIQIDVHNSQLLAGTLAALVMWRSKSLLVTIVVGMGAYLLLRLVVPTA